MLVLVPTVDVQTRNAPILDGGQILNLLPPSHHAVRASPHLHPHAEYDCGLFGCFAKFPENRDQACRSRENLTHHQQLPATHAMSACVDQQARNGKAFPAPVAKRPQ